MSKGYVTIAPMKIGYARVSTDEQNLDLQVDALTAHGCTVIHQDNGISGTSMERQGLAQALAALGKGDTLIVGVFARIPKTVHYADAGVPCLNGTERAWPLFHWA